VHLQDRLERVVRGSPERERFSQVSALPGSAPLARPSPMHPPGWRSLRFVKAGGAAQI